MSMHGMVLGKGVASWRRAALAWTLVGAACSGDSGGDTTGQATLSGTTTAMATTTSTSAGSSSSTTDDPTTGSTSTGSSTTAAESTSTGSSTTAADPVCGDGVVDAGEECDAGADNSDMGACTSACKNAVCGDGLVGPGEACDDANTDDGDACTNACALASCGDGVIQAGEACDDGNADDTDACLSTCVAATCGDGAVQAGVETCDDGNADETDTCTTLCKAPSCSDALKSGSESDVDCGGSCMACGLGGLCVDGGDCESGFCGGGTCKVAASCAALKTADPNAVSGVYTIDPDGMGGEAAYGVYCDMTTDGGGWTLVLNLDTSDGHVMWWGHALWTDSNTYGSAETAMTEDHVSAGWHNLGGGKEVLVLVHQEGATKGWKSFNKVTTDPMIVHLKGGDNVLIGSQKNSDVAGLWTQERLVRLSTNLYGNHCWQQGGLCTSGNQGSPDGDRIGSHEAIPSDNVGGGLGNWHDMNYCCNANYGSGKSCNGSAIRTASEAQAGWAPCYGGQGHFGTDTLVPSTNTCSNTTCAQANWSLKNGVDYDYAIMIR